MGPFNAEVSCNLPVCINFSLQMQTFDSWKYTSAIYRLMFYFYENEVLECSCIG